MAERAQEPPADYVFLGNLGKVFGLEGALHFRPAGEAEAQAVFDLDEVFVTGVGSMAIRDVRQHGKSLIVAFESVRRPERARGLVNARVFAHAESLPVPSGGAIYGDALRGLPVLIDGRPFGTVADLAGVSGAELLLVDRPVGGQAMLPLRAPYVQVGPDAVLVVDPPPGLIEPGGE
jgi:ribosomal 30S subunit maturation factor RimM